MAEQSKPAPGSDRRSVLRAGALGATVAGVGMCAAACSSANSLPQGSGAQAGQQAQPGPTVPTNLTTVSNVPVDGGFIDTDLAIVVTQPSAGEYKAFTAVCTHAQCLVDSVTDNVIQCPCHGSQYSAKDGSVINGPATQPLASKTIKVSGQTIIYEP